MSAIPIDVLTITGDPNVTALRIVQGPTMTAAPSARAAPRSATVRTDRVSNHHSAKGTTKNSDGRLFPLTRDLRTVLEAQRAHTDAVSCQLEAIVPLVFHRHGKPIRDFRGAWSSACKAAGCPGRIPHDFRRTAVRNLVRAGVPERVAMQLTGHKTRSVFERYNIVSESDYRHAADKLNQITVGTVLGTVGGIE